VVFDFIKEAVPYKVSHVPITGGEPMLHPDFVEICHFVRDHVSACPLYITGRLLNDTVLDEMEKRDRRWFWWLTIMSSDKELNDKYRSAGAFEDVVRATALLTERGHCVGIAINIVPETLPQLEDTIRFAFEELKVDYVATDPIAAMGRALDDPQNALLNDEQLYSYYRLMTDLIPKWQKCGKKISVAGIFYGVPKECGALVAGNNLNLHPDGLISPCCFFMDEEIKLGDMQEGVKKCTGFFRFKDVAQKMRETHINVEERIKKVGIWSCFECVLNYQIHNKGRTELTR
jgi:MoaA/NifB/PqqE/SkfB family radical SAM enzyme